MATSPKLLVDLLPELSAELEKLLIEEGEPELAQQVSSLFVFDRCRCGESDCGTFYVQPKSAAAYRPSFRNVVVDPAEGMMVLDVVEEKITCVEVLYRWDIRRRLIVAFP